MLVAGMFLGAAGTLLIIGLVAWLDCMTGVDIDDIIDESILSKSSDELHDLDGKIWAELIAREGEDGET